MRASCLAHDSCIVAWSCSLRRLRATVEPLPAPSYAVPSDGAASPGLVVARRDGGRAPRLRDLRLRAVPACRAVRLSRSRRVLILTPTARSPDAARGRPARGDPARRVHGDLLRAPGRRRTVGRHARKRTGGRRTSGASTRRAAAIHASTHRRCTGSCSGRHSRRRRPGRIPAARARCAGRSGGAVLPRGRTATRAAARRAVRVAVRRRTGVRAHRLRARCTLATPYDATCRSAWRDAGFRYRGTMFVWSGAAGNGASFSGTRTVRGCRGPAQRCTTALRWMP